jgi:hypothetical protein
MRVAGLKSKFSGFQQKAKILLSVRELLYFMKIMFTQGSCCEIQREQAGKHQNVKNGDAGDSFSACFREYRAGASALRYER